MSEERTKRHAEEAEEAREEIRAIEDDPPQRLEDWPGGKAKYQTFGGEETDSAYGEGPTGKLGPADVRYEEDGGVTVKGEPVDDPDEFKGDPIPGGPTDEQAPPDLGSEDGAQEAREQRED
jgi:hypothetical protein